MRVTCRLRELRRYRRYPGEGSAVTPGRVDAVSEFGPNLDRIRAPEVDRRSREIAGDRMRSTESRPTSPIFADLRSFSPASGVLDPIWVILKPLNYIALIHE